MDTVALHLEVRNAIALSDELGRYEHALGNDDLARHLAAVRTMLGELERAVGRSHRRRIVVRPSLIERVDGELTSLRERREEIPASLRPRVGQLMSSLERIVFAERRPSAPVPAKPVLGLPVRRSIPQTAHSFVDYATALALLASAIFARTRRARAVGLVLGAKLGGGALVTDSRLSVARWISIELHEVVDHASGMSAAVAPLVLGYRTKDPIASAIQIAAGVGMVVVSLFTDYRAAEGIGRPVRARGGPGGRRRGLRARVAEVQRPLEGLASPSVLPRLDV